MSGWIGIGYDSVTMIGSAPAGIDMTVILLNSSTNYVAINDYVSFTNSAPYLDTSKGCNNDITLLGYYINSTTIFVSFSREIDTGDVCDCVLNPSNAFDMIWAFGSKTSFNFHQNNYGIVQANFIQGVQGTASDTIDLIIFFTQVHAWFLGIGWGIIIDIAIFFGRYLKAWNKYILVHALLTGFIVLGTYFLEIVLIVFGIDCIIHIVYYFFRIWIK